MHYRQFAKLLGGAMAALFLAQCTIVYSDSAEASHAVDHQNLRSGTLTRQNLARSGEDFRRCLAAAASVDAAKKAYDVDKGTLSGLLKAQQALTAAQMRYTATMSDVRGNPALRDYLARRGEVLALTDGLEEARRLACETPSSQKELLRQETIRYSKALEKAQRDLALAEKNWKTTERAQQAQTINRRAAIIP